MARSVVMTGIAPAEVKTKSGDSVWVCRCGLTANADGTCNGNHKKFKVAEEDKDKLYCYDKTGRRQEVLDSKEEKGDVDCCSGCCSGCGGADQD